jgi:hypothetical protein
MALRLMPNRGMRQIPCCHSTAHTVILAPLFWGEHKDAVSQKDFPSGIFGEAAISTLFDISYQTEELRRTAAQTKRWNGEEEFRGRSVADENRPVW